MAGRRGQVDNHGWTTIRSRRHQNSEEERQNRNVFAWTGCTTFFVSNIPEGTTPEILHDKYGGCGSMADAFVSRRKDKSGSLFAFIRFRRVGDRDKLLLDLNSVMFNGAKPTVSLPRFDRNGKVIEYNETRRPNESDKQKARTFKAVSSEVSYRDMVGGFSNKKPTVIINLDDGMSGNMGGCSRKSSLIGYAKDLVQLNDLRRNLKMLNTDDWELKYLGGLRVLISFSSEIVAREVLSNDKMWKLWLFSLQWWEEQQVQFERVAWIKISGIPPTLWNADSCNMVASRFGEVLVHSKACGDDTNYAFDYVAILTKNGATINEKCVVSWKGRSYDVWIQEVRFDWLPDCCHPVTEPPTQSNVPQEVPVATAADDNRQNVGDNGGYERLEQERLSHGDGLHGEQGSADGNALLGTFNTFNMGSFQCSEGRYKNGPKFIFGAGQKTSKGAQSIRSSKPTSTFLGPSGGPDVRPRKRPRSEVLDLNKSWDVEENRGSVHEDEGVNVVVPNNPLGDPQVPVESDVIVPESNLDCLESPRTERNSRILKEMSVTCDIASAIGINLQENLEELEQVIRGDGVFDLTQ